MRDERCDMSYWFPRLEATGVPVPKTHLIHWPDEPIFYLSTEPREDVGLKSDLNSLVAAVREKCDEMGYPCFLRTGQGSGKHQFKDCCYVESPEVVETRIRNLVEWSEMVDMMGLSCRNWAVREYLPVLALAKLHNYGDMPLVREIRCFISDGRRVSIAPYWPEGAILKGVSNRINGRVEQSRDQEALDAVAELWRQAGRIDRSAGIQAAQILDTVATAFADDGAWSLDLLWTKNGWYAIDMAEAHRSYGCPESLRAA
jgi:hypothetical protein